MVENYRLVIGTIIIDLSLSLSHSVAENLQDEVPHARVLAVSQSDNVGSRSTRASTNEESGKSNTRQQFNRKGHQIKKVGRFYLQKLRIRAKLGLTLQ